MKMVSGDPLFLPKPGEVHIWLFNLDESGQDLSIWEQLLSEDEIGRSEHYRFEQERSRFIARRGILRQLLGHYTGMEPAEVAYHVNPFGKLSLPSHPLQFNLSSCQNRVVFAFALEKEIGVDIEQVHSFPELESMSERWFSSGEQAGLFALGTEMRIEAFFHIWTQKESFLKAHGEGMFLPLQDFTVSVDPNETGSLLSINWRADDASRWKIVSHVPEAGWRVAICVCEKTNLNVFWYMPDLADFLSIVASEKTSLSKYMNKKKQIVEESVISLNSERKAIAPSSGAKIS
jgi:4'-phosphopantetheinyl transferase